MTKKEVLAELKVVIDHTLNGDHAERLFRCYESLELLFDDNRDIEFDPEHCQEMYEYNRNQPGGRKMKEIIFNIDDLHQRDFDMVLHRIKQNIPEQDVDIKSITVEYEPFDWVKHIERKIEHNQLMLELLKAGCEIATLEGKTTQGLKEILADKVIGTN